MTDKSGANNHKAEWVLVQLKAELRNIVATARHTGEPIDPERIAALTAAPAASEGDITVRRPIRLDDFIPRHFREQPVTEHFLPYVRDFVAACDSLNVAASERDALRADVADAEARVHAQTDNALELYAMVRAAESALEALRGQVAELEVDAARYRWLRDSQNCSLSVSHNDHHNMYLSVADTMDDSQGYYGGVPDAERARMIETDTIWTVHVYPNTPVGFNVFHAASLDAAIDAAASGAGGGG